MGSTLPVLHLLEALLGSVQVGGEGGDAALHDLRVLVLIFADAVEVLNVARATQQLHEVLVMSDDQQLEVALAGATLDDPAHTNKHKHTHTHRKCES